MPHTDPIADMLTRMKNAIMAEKRDLAVPLSNTKLEIAKILKGEGYIANFRVEKAQVPAQLLIELKYSGRKQNVIEGLKRVSNGLGVAVISTSQGILTGAECQKRGIGGEVLLHVW